ncbi:BTAD domain-containing putative transcriptional regulator [Streptomyces sp. NPDC059752]|uniref:AfsR/SARP family transcriptional regulator n=1 Tax=unclassified Streptomyces TaxID=2593676 RepID=UPI00365070C8
MSRLRRALPGAAVEAHPAGYRLVVEPDAVDVVRFERLVSAGRGALARDPAAAARLLRESLELWRGPALLDVAAAASFRAPVTRLSELRMAALEDRIEADLRVGRGRELTGELASLVAEHPLREGLVGALMRALVAAGRPAEALTAYGNARAALAEELGADPSPELSALHTAVLRGQVEVPPGPPPAPTAPRRWSWPWPAGTRRRSPRCWWASRTRRSGWTGRGRRPGCWPRPSPCAAGRTTRAPTRPGWSARRAPRSATRSRSTRGTRTPATRRGRRPYGTSRGSP